ncbi:MAG: hypothetical protein ATN35_04070 [Epulopiscium sp. Nele67-Bin004]|nr:MAG: hypothetical protein ATN35_04070 [Epulopiscium sp. Nele67-Bin004]
MGLYQRSNGVYYLSFSMDNKRYQKSLNTKNKHLADELYSIFLKEKFLKSTLLQLSNTQNTAPQVIEKPKQESKSFHSHYLKYLELCESNNLSIRTIEGKKWALKLFKQYKINTYSDINSAKLDKFWQWAKTKYKDDSIRKLVAYLKTFLNHAVKKGYYSSADYHKLTFPKLTTNVREEVISVEDWEKIQSAVKDDFDFLTYLRLLYNTGLRPSEGLNLRYDEVDFENCSIKVYQTKTKSYKTVFIPKLLADDLAKLKHEFLFIRDERGNEYYSKKFSKLKKALNLNKDYTLYTFRHTFATNLLNKTNDIHLVSKALGHSNIMITSKHYANRSTKDIQDRVSVLWTDS